MLLSLVEFLIVEPHQKSKARLAKKKPKPSQTFDEVCSVPVGVVLGGAAVSAAHADLPPGGQLHVRGPGLAPAAHIITISNVGIVFLRF